MMGVCLINGLKLFELLVVFSGLDVILVSFIIIVIFGIMFLEFFYGLLSF